jgi:hypothetical protein
MTATGNCVPGLYPELLGAAWADLDEGVRRLHGEGAGVRAAGVFRVRRGSGRLARLLARLVRLPAAAETVDLQLVVVQQAHGEEWRRTFGTHPLTSFQSRRHDGLLVERMGPVELRFALRAEGGALLYRSTGASMRLGPLRIPLPRRLAPRVEAWERPAGEPGRAHVAVEVHLPLAGLLVAYEGSVTRVEADA